MRKNRSDNYQYKIVEISVDPIALNDVPENSGLGFQLNLAKHSEEFQELRSRLFNRLIEIVDTHLTARQAQVVHLRLQGKTQTQIGEELGLVQSTICKTISGNLDYTNNGKRYGGAIKKLKKVCSKDEEIREILEKLGSIKKDINFDWLGEK